MLSFCLCGIILTKNACGAHSPPLPPCDDAGGPFDLFLLNDVGVSLVSLHITSYLYLFLRLVHQSSLTFCPNNSLCLPEKILAFSFGIFLGLCSFIKALRTDKRLLFVNKE